MLEQRVFFSYHYERDAGRVARVRAECASSVTSNDSESAKLDSSSSIERWINRQLAQASCTVVLIGSETAHRDWIDYEIARSWEAGKGVLGIYVHSLRDQNGCRAKQGVNPFEKFVADGLRLSDVVKTYDPWDTWRQDPCYHLSRRIGAWVHEAIHVRNRYPGTYATRT